MSKYKVGDKVLLEATIVDIWADSKHPIKVEFADKSAAWFNEECLMPDMTSVETIPQEEVMQSAYNQGLTDAWELTRKLYDMRVEEVEKIFDTDNGHCVVRGFTPQEAIAKLKAYEEAQEIKVGEIVSNGSGVELLVTAICNDESRFDGIKITPTDEYGKLGATYSGMIKKYFTKTGKHIDIQSILEQIGGE